LAPSILFAAQLLRCRPLPPEEAVAALDRFRTALADVHHHHLTDRLDADFDRRIAVAGDVLDPGPERVAIGDPDHCSVILDPKENLPSHGIGEGCEVSRYGRGQCFLVFQHGAFALMKDDVHVAPLHCSLTREEETPTLERESALVTYFGSLQT